MSYKIIDIAQDTPEWLEWRRSGITATEASIIIGANPYETKEDLFLVKSGQKPAEFKNNEAIQRGKDLEPIVRDKINNHYEENFQPACVQNLEYNWMIASLDGLSSCSKIVLEVKCPSNFGSYKKNHTIYEGCGLDDKELRLLSCPGYYYAQQQWQIACVQGDVGLFVPFYGGNWKAVEIYPDTDYVKDMKEQCWKFWQEVQEARLKHEN